MRWAKANSNAPWIVTVPGDTPFLPYNLVERLFAAKGPAHEFVIAKSRGTSHPVIGVWQVALADQLTQWLEDKANRKTMDFVEARSFFALNFEDEVGRDPFFNVNTQEALDLATKWADTEIERR